MTNETNIKSEDLHAAGFPYYIGENAGRLFVYNDAAHQDELGSISLHTYIPRSAQITVVLAIVDAWHRGYNVGRHAGEKVIRDRLRTALGIEPL